MKKILKYLYISSIIMFMVFFVFSFIIGGDALNGLSAKELYHDYISGNYYVANHSNYTVVSKYIWICNIIVEIIAILLIMISIILGIIYRVIFRINSRNNNTKQAK